MCPRTPSLLALTTPSLDVKARLARLGPSADQSHPLDLNVLRVQHRYLSDFARLTHDVHYLTSSGILPPPRKFSLAELRALQHYCEELVAEIANHPAQPLLTRGPLTTALLERPATNATPTPTASSSSPDNAQAPEVPEEASSPRPA